MALDFVSRFLKNRLRDLYRSGRQHTFEKYHRINPFFEDLFDWKERGKFWTGKENVTIYNSAAIVGDVDIGENTWIGPYCALDGTGGLKIGKNCSISSGCQILSHDSVKWALSGGIQPYEYSSTEIGDNCFIGTFSVVRKGVKIGNQCVVGAGSVITKSFADRSVIAGVPARHIGNVIILQDGMIDFEYFE